MGKGDIKSKRGKITNGTFGVRRKRLKNDPIPVAASAPVAVEAASEESKAKKVKKS